MSFESKIVGTINPFRGTITPDKNGEGSIFIQCIAGKMPNRNVRSGTVAKNSGFEVGKTYLIEVREIGYDEEFGVDYQFSKILELTSAADIIDVSDKLGPPEVFGVDKPDNDYERKSTAVEGVRTKRIAEGKYKPVGTSTVTNHQSAAEVIQTEDTTNVQKGASVETEVEHDFLDKNKK